MTSLYIYVQVVKFTVNDQLLTSSPSDSNNSTDSGAGSSTNELKIVSSAKRSEQFGKCGKYRQKVKASQTRVEYL